MMSTEYYKLGAKFCRHQYKNGGVCVFVHESIDFNIIPTHHICKKKDLEICAVILNLPKIKTVIVTIYKSPTGNYVYFLRKLESLWYLLYIRNNEFIICVDINIILIVTTEDNRHCISYVQSKKCSKFSYKNF